MKKFLLFPFLFLSLFIWTGCSDDEDNTSRKEDIIHELDLPSLDVDNEYMGDTENPIKKWDQYDTTYYQTLLTDNSKIFSFDCVSSKAWGISEGFCFSNLKSGNTSAITGKGKNKDTYITSFYNNSAQSNPAIRFTDGDSNFTGYQVEGLYVTNAFTAVNVIENGNEGYGPTDPFKDGDWFKLTIYALEESNSEAVSFYLADFREGKSEIVKDWAWVDLTALGETKGLRFELSSSDLDPTGQWMDTPAYFCLDGVKLIEKAK